MKTKQGTVTHIDGGPVDPKVMFVHNTAEKIMVALFVADTGEQRRQAIKKVLWDAMTAVEEATAGKTARGPYARR